MDAGWESNACAEFIFNGMRDFEVRIVIRDGKFFIYLFKKTTYLVDVYTYVQFYKKVCFKI